MKTRTIRKTFEGQTIKNCAYCGMIFYAKSNKAMYCTNSHKSLHWLEKQKDKKPQLTFEEIKSDKKLTTAEHYAWLRDMPMRQPDERNRQNKP